MPIYRRFLSGFLNLFFRLLYHQLAWTYDLVAWTVSLGMWKRWVETVLPQVPNGEILEWGHGPGHLQLALYQRSPESRVFGLDASRQMGALARRRLKLHNQNPNLIRGYAQFSPFPAGAFHAIIATFPSPYILELETLQESMRILKPGGKLIILPAAWITDSHPIYRFAAWVFRFTGQAPDLDLPMLLERYQAPFVQAGFRLGTEMVELNRSKVLLVVAAKPGGSVQPQADLQ